MQEIADWNGISIPVARSHGGVIAVADFADNVVRTGIAPWPPAPLVMKLYESRQKRAFATDDLHVLSKRIGIYSDVQSMHSEDALTWSFFGPLAWSGESTRVAWLN
jgi:hypothetical protein